MSLGDRESASGQRIIESWLREHFAKRTWKVALEPEG